MKEELSFNSVYSKIQELLKNGKNTVSVLEEQVDIELQAEYFRTSKKLLKNLDKQAILIEKDDLLDKSVAIEKKKELLSSLAKIDSPEAYRVLEMYKNSPDEDLAQWSKLAFQESKMVLETSLLGKAPIFISTGLGGQGDKLRYFIAIVSKDDATLEKWQVELVSKEMKYSFGNNQGVLEEVEAHNNLIFFTGLLPIVNNVQKTIALVVKECNELGGFLRQSFIVTNVKKLSLDEVKKMVDDSKEERPDSNDLS